MGGWGYYELLNSYRDASERMLASVDELKISTQSMTGHLARIEKVEQIVAEIKAGAAKAKDLDSARAEYRKLAQAQHLDVRQTRRPERAVTVDAADRFTPFCSVSQTLDVKAHIWGLEQDLDQISRRAQTVNVRI